MNSETQKYSTCCSCGFKWLTGQHGGHSCSDTLSLKLRKLEKGIRSKQRSLRARAGHIGKELEHTSYGELYIQLSVKAYNFKRIAQELEELL